jgi:2-keto-4-pentenoate hydratase/2-oxohepta-3-ene-1,7-dioic acid hydratase in catechol pathway
VRFVRFWDGAGPAWGRLAGDSVEVLSGPPYAGGQPTGARRALEHLRLLAPAEPSKVLCVGLNYRTHREDEKGDDALVAGIISQNVRDAPPDREPILFLKAPSAIVGPGEPIVLPPETVRADYEAELALVIGRRLRRATREEAVRAIFGYTCANDVTARDIQERDVQWMRAKSFDSFCPVGPWIETDFDPADAPLEGLLNGEVRQRTSTRFLIADPAELVRFASQAMTLVPGDLFLTGTPTGVGPLGPGDRFTVRVGGIGELENPVVAHAAADPAG